VERGMPFKLTRRGFVAGTGGLLAASLAPAVLHAEERRFFLLIGLRGGLDGLTAMPPVGDPDYQLMRGKLALNVEDVLPLDGFFGLHPSLAHLHRSFHAGEAALHHATGLPRQEMQSHFVAWRTLCAMADEAAGGTLPMQTVQADHFENAMKALAQSWTLGRVPDACGVAFSGWDMHAAQGAGGGLLAQRLSVLDRGLWRLREGLSPVHWRCTCILVVSEFGRHVTGNAAGGTEHGGAGVALVLGGGVRGGVVHADWPGLKTRQLQSDGLKVTRDIRPLFSHARFT